MSREQELLERLAQDKGDPVFAELADLYMAKGQVGEALTTLLAGLTANPDYHPGRLVLARLFAHLGYTPFAVRELSLLREARPECQSLERLLEAIAPGSSASPKRGMADSQSNDAGISNESGGEPALRQELGDGEETIAEGEFDIDILEKA
jgi:predicted Zn-dependent protease